VSVRDGEGRPTEGQRKANGWDAGARFAPMREQVVQVEHVEESGEMGGGESEGARHRDSARERGRERGREGGWETEIARERARGRECVREGAGEGKGKVSEIECKVRRRVCG